MKIVFLQDDFPPQSFGGAGISTYELALGMKKAGHEVFVITTCRKEIDAGESEREGLKIHTIVNNYSDRWRAYVSLNNRPVVRQIERILEMIRPDVVHANNIHAYLSYKSLKVAKKYAKAVVLTARDSMLFSYDKLETKKYLNNFDPRVTWLDNLKQAGKRWNPFRNLFIRHYLNYVDKVFAISHSLKDALERNGIKNVGVIYNGIDVDEWNVSENAVKKFKEKYQLANKKIIFFNGRLSSAKGGNVVLKAIKNVSKEVPEAVLLVAGIGEVSAKDDVIFTGWLDREEIKVAYAASDVVLMPSICLDAFGRVNIEAMASKKPVVGTCYGGTPEIIEDGVTGYVVNPLQIDEFSAKIIDLLKNPEKAEKFGRAGRNRIQTVFNLNDKITKLISIYERFI